MPRQAPKVIAGMRAPRDTRMESMAEVERNESNPELTQVIAAHDPKKGTLYCSKFPGYRVQITSPEDTINPATGHRTKVKGIAAIFKNGRYLNDTKDKRLRKLIDDKLQENSRFGKPDKSDYWLATEQDKAVEEKQLADARRTLEAMPKEAVVEFMATLKKSDAADHDLTPPAA